MSEMTDHHGLTDWHLDKRVPIALIFAIAVQTGAPAKHAGILSGNGRFIHAYSGKAVSDSVLSPWWREKLVAAFTWPERPSSPIVPR